ncbi:hypothetical protein CI610_01814 [invertebrate metagenome]|uniref:Uncharacterized protein n=1 Tax=invertebrate metagenome TaxID=1711999 RepID=A0A2H9T7Q5_9ZZZZ
MNYVYIATSVDDYITNREEVLNSSGKETLCVFSINIHKFMAMLLPKAITPVFDR